MLAREEAGAYHYYHSNEHGDMELLTEETGRITNRYQYEAFGGLIEAEEEEKNRFRYSGEVEDELTGQYYLRARYYCPRLGRFTQEDSYRGDGLNLYAYCRNNPVFYIDPSGYEKNPCEVEGEESKREINGESERNSETDFIPYTDEMRKYIQTPATGYDAYLEKLYIKIRKQGLSDVEIVAKNTGISVQEIINYKKHVFLNIHDKVSFDGKSYTTTYFTADPDLACSWLTAQKQELNLEQKEWFRQQVNHELAKKALMDQGWPLRDITTYNPNTERFESDPTKSAHDAAPPQPKIFLGAMEDPDFSINKALRNIDDYYKD